MKSRHAAINYYVILLFFRFGVHKWSIKKIVCMFLFKSVMNDDREKNNRKIRDKLSSYKMAIICANVPHNSYPIIVFIITNMRYGTRFRHFINSDEI